MMAGMNPGMGCAPMQRQQPCMTPGMGMAPVMNPGMAPGANQGMNQGAIQSREQLMRQINEASFAMDDVLLFLDTHPNNQEALQYYKNVSAMRKNAVAAYERQFGPLLVDSVTGNAWSWVTGRWPWEGGC